MAFSSKGRTQTTLAEINITPLVDVVLVLLLIFMLTAPVLQSGVEVAIPKTRTVNQLTEERMVVTIDKEQNVFLQDKPVNVNALPSMLRSTGAVSMKMSSSTSTTSTSGVMLISASAVCVRPRLLVKAKARSSSGVGRLRVVAVAGAERPAPRFRWR